MKVNYSALYATAEPRFHVNMRGEKRFNRQFPHLKTMLLEAHGNLSSMVGEWGRFEKHVLLLQLKSVPREVIHGKIIRYTLW